MKKYKAILEENVVKVIHVLANSQQEAEQKAKELSWNIIDPTDQYRDIQVNEYLEDEEILMDSLRADEGWVITYGIPHDTYRIEKDDDYVYPFKDDICAIQFVIARMLDGSKLHIRAFKFAYANGSEDDRKVLQEKLHYAIVSK